MDVKIENREHWVIVRVQGRIDSFNYELISTKIMTLIKVGKKHIALDLGGAQFLSLPTIRFLNSTAKKLKADEGQLALVSPSLKTRRHIEIFGSLEHLDIYDKFSDFDRNSNQGSQHKSEGGVDASVGGPLE